MWITLKVFPEFVTIVLLFYALVFWPRGMWDPSSLPWEEKSQPLDCQGSPLIFLCIKHKSRWPKVTSPLLFPSWNSSSR